MGASRPERPWRPRGTFRTPAPYNVHCEPSGPFRSERLAKALRRGATPCRGLPAQPRKVDLHAKARLHPPPEIRHGRRHGRRGGSAGQGLATGCGPARFRPGTGVLRGRSPAKARVGKKVRILRVLLGLPAAALRGPIGPPWGCGPGSGQSGAGPPAPCLAILECHRRSGAAKHQPRPGAGQCQRGSAAPGRPHRPVVPEQLPEFLVHGAPFLTRGPGLESVAGGKRAVQQLEHIRRYGNAGGARFTQRRPTASRRAHPSRRGPSVAG